MPVAFSISVLSRDRRSKAFKRRTADPSNLRPVMHQSKIAVETKFNSIKLAFLNTRSLKNKSFVINDLITTNNLDFMFLIETWLEDNCSATVLTETAPPNFNFISVCRTVRRGGGVAALFKDVYQCKQVSFGQYLSFEYLGIVLIDHNILLERLENWVGLSGMALKWFRSYLEGRGYFVSIGEHKSKWTSMTCGVPQGSILAPLLFSLYMLPLSQIMRKNQIAYHSYADDTQIYLALSPNDYSPIDSLCQCIDEINSWMCQNFLQLNKEKTEVIAFGNKDEVLKVNAYLDSRGQTTKNQVRNLGVILETDLSFSSHVKAVTKSAYYHLKNIARIRCFVSSHDLEKLVHAFITSRVDYCNGLLTGLPKKTIRQLQLIQNAAARILTRTRKYEHITPVLRSLHWLPVTFRIDFKVLLLVYKSLNGLGPKYMSDMLTEYKPNRPLRSLGSSQLEIPRVHTKQGESAFSYYAARSWNQLPEEIRCAKTLATFKSSLKTHLFSCAFVE